MKLAYPASKLFCFNPAFISLASYFSRQLNKECLKWSMGTCLWKVSLSSSQEPHFKKQNKEQPYNQVLWNWQTLLSGRLLKGWRRIPRNCNSTPRDLDARGSRDVFPEKPCLSDANALRTALLSHTVFSFCKLNHFSPPIVFSVPTGWFSPRQDALTYFLCILWYRAHTWARSRGTCLPCYDFRRPGRGRGSHNTTHQTMQMCL